MVQRQGKPLELDFEGIIAKKIVIVFIWNWFQPIGPTSSMIMVC